MSAATAEAGRPHRRQWPGPGKRTFVCLHAIGGSHVHWLGVAPGLAARGRVIAPDLAGFGRTPVGPRGSGIEAQRELVSGLLDETGPAILVGSSMGAGIALLEAAREPDSVTALVLSGALLPPHRDGRSPRRAFISFALQRGRRRLRRARRIGRVGLSREALYAEGLRGVAADPASIDPAIIAASVALSRERGLRESVRAIPRAGWSTMRLLSNSEGFARIIDRVRCPVLVIHGGRDPILPVEFAIAAARARPAWTLRVFDGLGHLPHLEDREGWLIAVEGWLDTLPGA